jgi:DNA-binding transcriptional ArsR family regulator
MKRIATNYIIRDKQQMRALAASTRQEIVDVLPRMGTVSVAELATALGRPADSLYYHLRMLVKVGLVLTAGSRIRNGRSEALYHAVARELRLWYKLGKNGNGSEIVPIVASMLRLGVRDFRKSFKAGHAAVSGSHRELWALRKTAWLSKTQLAEINRGVENFLELTSGTGRKGKLYGVTVLLTPLERGR